MSNLPNKPLFTIPEAVDYLGVSRATVYNWIQTGELLTTGPPYFQKITYASLREKLSKLSIPFYDD